MEDEYELPWWQSLLRGIGLLLGLIAMSALLMGMIIAVAQFFGSDNKPVTTSSQPSKTPPPEEQNARTRTPSPYAPEPWPNFGSRSSGSMIGSRPSGVAGKPPAKPEPPVGLSPEDYQAAVADGKKVYLPNPKGECDLDGGNSSLRALENCFAARAARSGS